MAGHTKPTAVQRALQMPEILSRIFERIYEDYKSYYSVYDEEGEEEEVIYSYGREGVLVRCGLVNNLWYHEAMRLLWRAPTVGFYLQNSFVKYFAKIDPARRQFYANYVEEAKLVTVNEERAAECDDVLKDVAFPRLKGVGMVLDDWNDGFYVPRIGKHWVTHLEIDPRFEYNPTTYGMTIDEMGMILEQIPVRLSNLQATEFRANDLTIAAI